MEDIKHIELIANCLKGDKRFQKELYDLILPYLESICRRYLRSESDVGDALQNSFIKIFKNLELFNPTISSLQTWSSKIGINTCLNMNNQRRRLFTEELKIELHETLINPISQKIGNEELLIWLKQMPEDYFVVFNLFVIDGYSHFEISKLLDISEALSRKRLSRGRNWAKDRLNNKPKKNGFNAIIYN